MISASSATTAVTPASTPAPTHAVLEEAQKAAASSSQGQRNLRNALILEASMQVSIKAGNDSLVLLYRTAIDGINTVLEPELGANAIQNAMSQDNSAEATAGRIVSLSTAMFESFAARHPDKALEEVAKDFVNVIRGGFEQGYREAEDILNSLGVLGEGSPIAAGIAKTYELVQKGYDDWLAKQLGSTANTSSEAIASA